MSQKLETAAAMMPERDLLAFVLDYARARGWLAQHIYDSRLAATRTDKGSPDVLLVRECDGRVVYIECKAEGKKPTSHQWRWIRALRRGGHEVYIWWPGSIPEIERILA